MATVFQLYHGDMIYGRKRKNPKPTLLQTQEIFNLPHHIGMLWQKLAFDDAVSYSQWVEMIAAQLNGMAVTGIRALLLRITYPVL